MSSSDTPDQHGTIEAATAALHDRLDELQFRRSFEDSKFVVIDQDGYAFGAQFHRRVLGLRFAYMFDRTAIFVNEYKTTQWRPPASRLVPLWRRCARLIPDNLKSLIPLQWKHTCLINVDRRAPRLRILELSVSAAVYFVCWQ